ncbi:ABC transporter ATP-binding protein [Clostridiaceae bacterium HSG29]|nr:ABC transporter ATP-binding protein [Clostridiaceae bacterium HSG29]
MENKLISLKNIRKSYKMGSLTLEVLKGVDLEIEKGEYVAILGASGSGKSTMMNIIGCIDVKSEGEYHLNGESIDDIPEDELATIRNREIGFVFQKFNLISKFNILYNVQIPLLLKGLKISETVEKATEYLDKVGLGDRLKHKPTELSGGQQQRVAIARALICDPEIILADEPTGNLDSHSGEEILKIFNNLHDEGKTIIMITHDEHIAKEADRIIHLSDGLIESDIQNKISEKVK